MSYTTVIDGNQVFVEAGTLTIDKTIGKRSTANFIAHSDTSLHVEQYNQIQIFDSDNIQVFTGYAAQPQEQKPGWQATLDHTVSCIDQHFLADKRVIGKAYVHMTCGAIAMDLLNTILSQEGVSVGMIYDGLIPSPTLYPDDTLYPDGNVGAIPSATFVYCKVSEALDALVKQASASGVPYYWQIDENKQLFFVPYTAIVNSNVLDGTQIDDGTLSGVVPKLTRANPTYRNTQYLTGGVAQTAQQVETRIGDGHTTSWNMGYELAAQPTITVDGVTQTVAVRGSTGAAYYWGPKEYSITQDTSLAKLTSSNVLQVTYIGQYPAIFYAQDGAQVFVQAGIDGTTGIIEVVDQDSSIISSDAGFSETSQLLTRYAQQGKQFVFATLQTGYAPGQLVTVDYPPLGIANTQMLLEQVSISDQRDGLNLWQTITAVAGPYDVTWQDFFSKMFKQDAQASNINIGISSSLTLFQSYYAAVYPIIHITNATVYSCPVVSTTLYPHSDLYPC